MTVYKGGWKGAVKEMFDKMSQIHGLALFFEAKTQLWSFQTELTVIHSIQCFIIYPAPKYTISPFAQLQAFVFISGFLTMTERTGDITYIQQMLFLTVGEIAKGNGPFLMSHESIWIFCPLFSDMKKTKEAWGLSIANSHQV